MRWIDIHFESANFQLRCEKDSLNELTGEQSIVYIIIHWHAEQRDKRNKLEEKIKGKPSRGMKT